MSQTLADDHAEKEDADPMGVFSRIERRLEHGVGNAFARMFKGKVHPAEIARALQQDADDNATKIAKGRTLVPNRYVVWLGDTDYSHLREWERQLTRSLGDICREHFTSEGYSTYGAVKVEFAQSQSLRTGIFQVESRVDDAEPSIPLHDYLPPPDSRPAPSPAARASGLPPVPPPSPRFEAGYEPAAASYRPSVPARRDNPPQRSASTYQHMLVIDAENKRVALHPGRNVIGRGSAADVRVTDTGISRQHAEITTDGVLATVIDLQSTNGTLVNGKRVSRSALRHGDVIRVGRSVLVYRYEPEDAT
ncbi:FhaA domain-containing protein [Cumulibacter soli]|uniref:FhaA domain-containing protein n=1 Tax=Cumulibacter soli TaxID=2546344 RepID=UPI001FB868F9|nr:DUF3662 and FHA domain-containing protein [Cumulibacter soli]